MKFAREFKAALESEDYPEEWRHAALPYPTLKKCLNKIRAEFQDMGLDSDALHQLLQAQVVTHGDQIPLARYKFDVSESDVRPHLTLFVDLEDGVIVDASLSHTSRTFLQKMADKRRASATTTTIDTSLDEHDTEMTDVPATATTTTTTTTTTNGDDHASEPSSGTATPNESQGLVPVNNPTKKSERVEVTLNADSEFFRMIYRDLAELERIGNTEQKEITSEVEELGREVAAVAQPEKKQHLLFLKKTKKPGNNPIDVREGRGPSKYASDLPRWRELFELYVDAQVFFSTRQRDLGKAHTSAQASRQLDWFQGEVRKRGILDRFELQGSVEAYRRFLLLNKRLYLNLRFRELNVKAQAKILKKFDKWTALGASQTFPVVLSRQRHDLLVEGMARDVCARIAQDVMSVVPRFEDYACPVCMGLAWFPVRLRCKHVFCAQCVVHMQRENQKFCPMCREEVVMQANLDNLDAELTKFMQRYFRKEAKERQKANELERGIEMFGEDYKPGTCIMM